MRPLFYRYAFLAFLLLCLGTSLRAQEAEVHGTVTDTSGMPLIGAYIRVVGSVVRAAADIDGYYEIDVPPGRIRLIVSYIGYENFDTVLVVSPADRDIPLDVVLTDAYASVGEVIVFGRRATGQAQALRNQQSSMVNQTIIHSDVFNKYPDITIAETVARMPGVSIIRGVSEGELVQVRGLPEQYTAVDLNGQRLPTVQPEPDQTGSLDIIQSNLVEEVRVIKARTPDMDGDAIAGTVDFRLRQPEERFEVLLQAGGGANFGFHDNPDQKTGISQFAAVLNSELSDEKVYALAAGSYLRQGRGNRTLRYDYAPDGTPFAARPADTDRQTTRQGFVGAVELRPSIYNRMRLSYNYSGLVEDLVNRQLYVTNENDEASIGRSTTAWTTKRALALVALEVENNFPSTRIDYQLSFSTKREDLEDRSRALYFSPAGSTPALPSADLLEARPYSSLAGQALELTTRLQENIALDEDVAIFSINLTQYLTQAKNSFLQFGGRYRSKDRSYGVFSPRESPGTGEPATLAPGTFGDAPPLLAPAPNLRETPPAYALKERIAAAYGMYAANFSSRLSGTFGLRYEYLRVESAEMDLDSTNFDYFDVLPSLNLTYRFSRDRQLKFSYYHAVARPNYAIYRAGPDLPLISIDQFTQGNPAIERTQSSNFDLVFERYGRSDGVLTAGIYAKYLDQPTLQSSTTRFSEGRPTYHTTTVNFDRAALAGIELGFYQNLDFLKPGSDLRFFNLNGNYNYNAVSAESGELNFDSFTLPQAPRQTANLSIVCSNPKQGLSVVLAANYRGRIFDRLLDDRIVYRNALFSLDLAADYEIVKDITLYFRANNLTNNTFEEYFGEAGEDGALLLSSSQYGTWGVLGVRYQPGR